MSSLLIAVLLLSSHLLFHLSHFSHLYDVFILNYVSVERVTLFVVSKLNYSSTTRHSFHLKNSASSSDNIHASNILENCSPISSPHSTQFYLYTVAYPLAWKLAIILPSFEPSEDLSLSVCYRCISCTCVLDRIMKDYFCFSDRTTLFRFSNKLQSLTDLSLLALTPNFQYHHVVYLPSNPTTFRI